MFAIKPRGICLNKNAANIQNVPNQLPIDKEPSPPKLKSLTTQLNTDILSHKNQHHQNLPPADENKNEPLVVTSRIPKLSLKFSAAAPQQQQCIITNNQNQALRPTTRNNSSLFLGALLAGAGEQAKQQAAGGLKEKDTLIEAIVVPKKVVEHVQQQQVLPKRQKAALTREEIRIDEEDTTDEDQEIEDIDKSTSRDAIYLVCDIAKDIYDYMYTLEEEQSIKNDYLKDQKILTPKVRQRLVNWCIEIHSQLKLLPETLYMTIAVIDRYFDRVPVKQQSQVQLVAVGATLIASKYEEIYPPDVGDLMHLTQNSYSRREIMRIEIHILEQLNFNLGKPIPLAFLRRFSKAAHCDLKMHSIAKYLMELSLTEYECSDWRPSMLAAAALFTTIHLVHQDSSLSGSITRRIGLSGVLGQTLAATNATSAGARWNKGLVYYTHYTRKQLQEPAGILCKILKRAQKNPQLYACVKKNLPNLTKWPELKSTRVDELIKLGDRM